MTSILMMLVFSSFLTGVDHSDQYHFTEIEVNKLNIGKIICNEKVAQSEAGKTYNLFAIVNSSIEDVYKIIVDYESYSDFMPNVESVVVTDITDSTSYIDYTILLPLNLKKYYRVKMNHIHSLNSALISWHLVEYPNQIPPIETIDNTTGFWKLTPFEKSKNITLIQYHIYTDPGFVPLGFGWIVDYLIEKQLPDIMIATKNRVIKK